MRVGSVHLSFGAGAGILLAATLGATPAALAGMELAWLGVCFGLSTLFLAPWLARRQVLSVSQLDVPPRVTVHAGKTVPLTTRIFTGHTGRLVTLALARSGDSLAASERAPRLLVAAISRSKAGHELKLPFRMPLRGRTRGLRLHLTTSYPLGLVRASRFIDVDAEVVALPRLIPERDLNAQALLSARKPQQGEAKQRHLARGQGLPVSLREALPGDSLRDLHLRSSLRRGRWTSIERPKMANDSARVVVCFPSGSGKHSRRAAAAYEVAVSVAASILQAWTTRGLTVELCSGTPLDVDGATLDHEASPLCRSKNALQHLLALTELKLEAPVASTTPRAMAQAALGAQVIPVESLLNRPPCTVPAGEAQFTVWTDPHGRSLIESTGDRSHSSHARRELIV